MVPSSPPRVTGSNTVQFLKHMLSRRCSWLGRGMEPELDIMQPYERAGTTKRGFGLVDVALPYGATPRDDLTAWRDWCSAVLNGETPMEPLDSDDFFFDDDHFYWVRSY
jgi:hypothetical protein